MVRRPAPRWLPAHPVPGAPPERDAFVIDLTQLTKDPAVVVAIDAQRAAERMVLADPTLAQGDSAL